MENKNESSQTSSEPTASQPPSPLPRRSPDLVGTKAGSFLTNKLFLIALVMLIVFTLAYAGIYLRLSSKLNQITKSNPSPTAASHPSPTIDLSHESTGSAINPAPNGVGANWKTYTNTKYGFSFKYPEYFMENIDNSEKATLSKRAVDSKCVEGCTPPPGIVISILDNPNSLSAEEFAQPDTDLHSVDLKKYKDSELQNIFNPVIPISSVFAARFSGIQCGHSSAFYLKHKDKIIELNFFCDEDFDNLDQILSTFKFTQ